MKYDFDEYVSREKTDSLTVDGWREYLGSVWISKIIVR